MAIVPSHALSAYVLVVHTSVQLIDDLEPIILSQIFPIIDDWWFMDYVMGSRLLINWKY
jgi:hypothetical protein